MNFTKMAPDLQFVTGFHPYETTRYKPQVKSLQPVHSARPYAFRASAFDGEGYPPPFYAFLCGFYASPSGWRGVRRVLRRHSRDSHWVFVLWQ